ncbi:hypothetical protein IG631_15778 [Alternaria alternata]|nr:hypothetical protein IG631_15778 [Alternaria alternata]
MSCVVRQGLRALGRDCYRSGGECSFPLIASRSRNHGTSHDRGLARNDRRLFGNRISSNPHHSTNMDRFASSSGDRPDTSGNARFTSQAATAEDLLKAQTVGLVNLNDYRKRRAEALDRKERGDAAINAGENTPAEGYESADTLIGCSLICKV